MRQESNDGARTADNTKVMTRGAFLGTGAVAVATVGLGGVAAVSSSETASPVQPECGPTCPPTNFTWAIPAGILNTLWADIFPRMVAREWLNPGSTTVKAGMTVPQLLGELATLGGSGDFQTRLALVNAHFGSTNHVPFSVSGTGGYDFLVSDEGVEFFIPTPPQSLQDLLRYYSFRGTGRPAIGLPYYLSSAISAVSIDSPTGPSQISVNPSVILQQVQRFDPGCAEIQCIRRKLENREVIMGLETYRCLVEGLRCWQIEGSVYRGIMTEVPRVVANIWIEMANGTTTVPGAYAPRFPDPDDRGLRSLFEERLETSLPGSMKMHFELHPASQPAGMPWDQTDVVITNKGFFFPPLPAQPTKQGILGEMVAGRAGNPVFTDSKRTMQ